MPRTLYHYSRDDFVLDPHRLYYQQGHFKPTGLWISAEEEGHDDGWRDWCLREDFNEPGLQQRVEIVLCPDANILTISNGAEIDQFSRKFSQTTNILYGDAQINWARVARQYAGIIIAPYIWEKRLNTMWYYTWDCASGCIWDLSVIESVEPCRVVAASRDRPR